MEASQINSLVVFFFCCQFFLVFVCAMLSLEILCCWYDLTIFFKGVYTCMGTNSMLDYHDTTFFNGVSPFLLKPWQMANQQEVEWFLFVSCLTKAKGWHCVGRLEISYLKICVCVETMLIMWLPQELTWPKQVSLLDPSTFFWFS